MLMLKCFNKIDSSLTKANKLAKGSFLKAKQTSKPLADKRRIERICIIIRAWDFYLHLHSQINKTKASRFGFFRGLC